MEAARFSNMIVVFVIAAAAALQFGSSVVAQTQHVVGDGLGWTIPAGDTTAYSTWASRQTFTVGDSLLFNFTTGSHDVAEVTQAEYGPCTATSPIYSDTNGPATINLTTAGTHYYICRFTSHCSIGQKLAINVSAAPTTSPPTPPPTATPPPAPAVAPTTPPPAVSPTTPPPAPAVAPTTPPPAASPAPVPAAASTPRLAPTPSTTTTATPPPTSPSPTSPSGQSTPPPPPPSNNSAVSTFTGAAVPVAILSAALALFY